MNLNFVKEYHIEAKKLIAIAIPILLAQIAQNSMGMVDTIMAGRVSAADMAAISVGASIWFRGNTLYKTIYVCFISCNRS